MRKKIIILAALLTMACLSGCGDDEKEVNTTENENQTVDPEDSGENDLNTEEESEPKNEGAENDASEIQTTISVPMGTYVNGEQKNYCTVTMPAEYLFSASYTDENGVGRSYNETGNSSLQEVYSEGFLDSIEEAISYVRLYSYDDEISILYSVSDLEENSLDAMKAGYSGGTEFGTADHPAYWYSETDEDNTFVSIYIGYEIDDTVTLSIGYSLPSSIGTDVEETAQKLYDTVSVIN